MKHLVFGDILTTGPLFLGGTVTKPITVMVLLANKQVVRCMTPDGRDRIIDFSRNSVSLYWTLLEE